MPLSSVNDIRRTSREAKCERLQMNAQVEKLPRGLHDLTGMHPELFSLWQRFRMDCLSLRNQQMGTELDKNRDGFVTIIVGPDEFHRTDLDRLLLPRDPHTGEYVAPIRVAQRVANAPGAVLEGKGAKGSGGSDKGAVGAVLDYLGFLGGLKQKKFDVKDSDATGDTTDGTESSK